MFCTNCGKKIPSDAEFCTECGQRVSTAKGSAIQGKNKPRYLWLLKVLKWVGYPILFFFVFMALGVDVYYFHISQTVVAISIIAGSLLVILIVILQKYVKLFRYLVTGLLALSVLAGLVLLGIGAYRYIIQMSSSLIVTVAKGPVSGANVNIYELDANGGKGNLITGPLISDASGNVNFDLPPNLPKRLFIESKGGFYKSEATGQQVQLKDTDALTAVLPAGTETAAVTPFTHMAAALIQSKIQSGTAPDDAVISANVAVAKQYGLKSIFDTAPSDATNSNASQATSEEKQYGLLLGGFTQLSKNLGVRSIDLANALAKDWSDGLVDGKENGNPITISNGPTLGSAGINGLNEATNQFAKSEKNYTSLKESSISLNPVLEKISLRVITTSLPAWISGKQSSFAAKAKGGSLPLSWSVKSGSLPEEFSLSKDGIISGAYTLSGGVTKKIFPQFTLEVKDQQGQTQSVTLSVIVAPEVPKITTINPPTLIVDQSYEIIIATANGGLPPYTFQREAVSGPMPMGMQITSSGNNAVLSGLPQAKGSFSFRICVIDSASVEKCGGVAFSVKDKEVAAPAPAPTTVTPTTAGKWRGYYNLKECYVSNSQHPSDMPAEDIPTCPTHIYCGFASNAVSVTYTYENEYILDMGAHTLNKSSWTQETGGDIDSSDATTIQEAGGGAGSGTSSYTDTWKLQFYLSGGEKYVKGTYAHVRTCAYYVNTIYKWGDCSCDYSYLGGPVK